MLQARARRQHGGRPAVLPAVEQPPVNAGVSVRYSSGERHPRGLYPGCGRSDAAGAQSGALCLQSILRGELAPHLYQTTNTTN